MTTDTTAVDFAGDQATAEFEVTGMHCGSCVALITETLLERHGGTSATVDLDAARAGVGYDPVTGLGSLDVANGALVAGDAQDGAAGTSLTPDPTLDGAMGDTGEDACGSGATHPGAMGATNTCATGGSSTSGSGGDGASAYCKGKE